MRYIKPVGPAHVCLWSEKIHLDSREAVLIKVEQKSGFCRSMLRRGFESVVPCIEHSLGMGIEPQTSLIDDAAVV